MARPAGDAQRPQHRSRRRSRLGGSCWHFRLPGGHVGRAPAMLYLRNYLAQDAGGLTGRLDRRFEFRWPWLPGGTWETTVSVHLERAGYGTLLTLTDGPLQVHRDR